VRDRSVRDRLFTVIASMALIAVISIAGAQLMTEEQRRVVQRDERTVGDLQGLTTQLTNAIRAQETALDAYVLGGREEALDRYHAAMTDELRVEERMLLDAEGLVDIGPSLAAFQAATTAWRRDFADPAIRAAEHGSTAEIAGLSRAASDHVAASEIAIADVIDLLDEADSAVEARDDATLRLRELWGGIGVGVMIVVALISIALLRRWVTRPLGALLLTATKVESGERVSFVRERDDEIGRLGDALERMRTSLQDDAALSSVVNRFTEATTFAADDPAVASATLQALDMLVHPDAAVTHVLNRSKDRAVPEASIGDAHAEVLPLNALSRCPGIVRGSVYVTNDVTAALSVHCPVYPLTEGTLACVPLAHGEVVGSVHLAWATPHAFPLKDRASVARIAEHAALAIGNRRLLAALQGMASTDARTGLANTRTFDKALEEALLARREEETVAVLMIDIDHFKVFNDRYGHPAGDEALRAFAEILRTAIRDDDVAARYGGEEFAVLLPQADIDSAIAVAERIRTRTESSLISLGPGITDRISVSIGMATAPAQATDRLSLLRIADEALYRAKEAGRNRVEVAGRDDLSTPAQPVPVAGNARRRQSGRKSRAASAAR
jgi:diguanylate cyclase (GGDEF)-like protein